MLFIYITNIMKSVLDWLTPLFSFSLQIKIFIENIYWHSTIIECKILLKLCFTFIKQTRMSSINLYYLLISYGYIFLSTYYILQLDFNFMRTSYSISPVYFFVNLHVWVFAIFTTNLCWLAAVLLIYIIACIYF